jgi:hypothetical protein
MAVVCRSYTDEQEARGAVESLLAAGVPGSGIRVVMGEPERDARSEPQGSFAGTAEHGGAREDFAGREHAAGAGRGTYAGDADEQRRGSFADIDRETVAAYPEGVERQHVVGHQQVRRLLLDAGLAEDEADRDVQALHEGRVLVVADVGDVDARAALGE